MRRLLHITCSKWRILYCILQATLLKANRKYRPPLAAYFFAFLRMETNASNATFAACATYHTGGS